MDKKELLKIAEKINDNWQKQMPDVGPCHWERSAYMIGNMAAYEITKKEEYLDYAHRWAVRNEWKFNDGSFYGVDQRCADNQLCAEVYFKLIDMGLSGATDENILEDMKPLMEEERCDYWSWCDLIYMGFTFYHLMANRYNDKSYEEKVYRLYKNIRDDRKCYDKEDHFWHRDENYLPEVKREDNGEKIFWGRGNGWAFAGLARGLEVVDKNCKYYDEYVKDYKDMAESLKTVMNEDGSFNVSFYDKETYPYHETSSTSLICLGYLMGIRLGILDESYYEVADKCVDWLFTVALDEDGSIGWCQDVAGWPAHNVGKDVKKDYAVGTFLLIIKELFLRK